MKVLVACEESGAVRRAFRERGHDAWSCDILPSADHSPYHYQGSIEKVLYNPWNLVIAFPPCTHLACSGSMWFAQKRVDGRQMQGVSFFMMFMMLKSHYPGMMIAIENPVGVMSGFWRKPDQIIQPWQFGHKETKATCLWLENLPKLVPTDVVGPPPKKGDPARKAWEKVWRMGPGPERSRLRSATYAGIASAMAQQWNF